MKRHFTCVLAWLLLSAFNSLGLNLSGTITQNLSLSGKVEVSGQVNVRPGVTISVLPGTALIMAGGASIIADSAILDFQGSAAAPVLIYAQHQGQNWGKIEAKNATAEIRARFVHASAGQFKIKSLASGIFEDSYLYDYYQNDFPILLTEDASQLNFRRCVVSNYYEVNFIRTVAIVEDCLFQFMTADGIDFDNSPPGTILRNSTLRYGRGTNIDAVDFGKINFGGTGSVGLVENCFIHDISDKGISIGEGALDVEVTGTLFINCGSGISVKDNSFGRLHNNTIVDCNHGIELVEKNPGLGSGHAYVYNSILWNNVVPVYMNSTSTLQLSYSAVQGMPADSILKIYNADPRFRDVANGNYDLLDLSPYVLAGIDSVRLGAVFPNGSHLVPLQHLHLGFPNAFSTFLAGDTIQIAWYASPGLVSLALSFSSDEGASWQEIARGISADALQYTWILPNIYSSRCQIKVALESDPKVAAWNYLPFKIFPDTLHGVHVQYSIPAGYYTQALQLQLIAQPGDKIYYTLDGSDPTDRSSLYTASIPLSFDSIPAGFPEQDITASESAHPPYSYVRTSPVSHIGPNYVYWIPPSGTLFKAGIVKARIYREGVGLGPVETKSYFLHPRMLSQRYTLPVISLNTDPANLFDYYNGIYIPGAAFTGYSFTGNYEMKGRASERPAHFEYFDERGRLQISQNVGIRVRGEWIRSLGQKALTVYARQEYDEQNTFDYRFFDDVLYPGTKITQDKYKRIVLRNSGNNWIREQATMCRDAYIQSLFSGMNLKYQAARMSVLFINGEYWGLHDIRELNDHRGLEFHYGVEPDSIIMMEDNLDGLYQLIYGNDGDVQDFHRMRNFILNSDLNISSNYDSLKSMLDIENFADYWIAAIFTNKINMDHNKAYWKYRNGKPAPGVSVWKDGRWRFVANDHDSGFEIADFDNLDFLRRNMADGLLDGMLRCKAFSDYFLMRFTDLMNAHFKTSTMQKKLDAFYQLLQPEMEEHVQRWGRPASYADWQAGMHSLYDYAEDRPAYQREHLRLGFGMGGGLDLELKVNDPLSGYVRVNTLLVNPTLPGVNQPVYPWSGIYLKDQQIELEAIPYSGYRFVRWKEPDDPNSILHFEMDGAISLTAEFARNVQPAAGNFSVYPNPANTNVVYFAPQESIRVYDVSGKLLMQAEHVQTLDISSLSNGVYFIENNFGERIKLVRL